MSPINTHKKWVRLQKRLALNFPAVWNALQKCCFSHELHLAVKDQFPFHSQHKESQGQSWFKKLYLYSGGRIV